MRIFETALHDDVLDKLIALSVAWEAENSTYGYRRNDQSDIAGNRIFLAESDGKILGYLLGHTEKAEHSSSIMAEGTDYFEIEELYVVPERRSQGIGKALFQFVQQKVQDAGVGFLMLSTATKNYRSILHFYIEELEMDFWSARLFKRL